MPRLGGGALLLALLAATQPAFASADPVQPYVGRWDLTLHTPGRAASSWLEVRSVHGHPEVTMVGRWGHARRLPSARIVDGRLEFVSPGAEEGRDTDMVFAATREGDQLAGTTTGPDGTPWTWRGVRAPALRPTGTPAWDPPELLFDGQSLAGWTAVDPTAAAWQVHDGTLVSPGRGTNLASVRRYGDFRLHLEFNCAPGANSGVYLRGRYEVQIEDDPVPEGPTMRTGGVYGFLAPTRPAPRRPGVWHALDVMLLGREVTVVLDGHPLIRRRMIPGPTGGALDTDEGAPGPVLLQGAETGHVAFRNIRIQSRRTR